MSHQCYTNKHLKQKNLNFFIISLGARKKSKPNKFEHFVCTLRHVWRAEKLCNIVEGTSYKQSCVFQGFGSREILSSRYDSGLCTHIAGTMVE